ncbi:uncharacterized protein LOC118739644 isoform X2 [Rhagoletis pomonella]|uniref:uncharacterized protein LOC118739644 isoform X2 n=1 Tax=Rhagoletis pomonella TaxID=28610 RepID=UPI001782F300|nr:uncharacterized protein LOC118739644 isoform X2 [Rhagoletis pomonella]XP_036326982.1 uncharacterized protein LOC118739644 isoform X2 [Rhagoletis pomonella]XP_036326983.1 uncharacterized protein LOC118739644 isoform X2 [Rhagoletis pomonella]XP_036326985.1 uncharacterized protein LOC118739644 isoform X2 [Rhagoletis pomonella]
MCALTVKPHKQCHKWTEEQCDDSRNSNISNYNNINDYDEENVQQQIQEPNQQLQQTLVLESMLGRQHQRKQRDKRQWQSMCSTRRRAGIKWKIIISTIILLLCRISHVLAIRKGRLMSPSSFTALSGDLHVQIQFSGEDVAAAVALGNGAVGVIGDGIDGGHEVPADGANVESTSTGTTTGRTTTTTARTLNPLDGMSFRQVGGGIGGLGAVENTITSTLVISKIIDDFADTMETTTRNDTATYASSMESAQFNGSLTSISSAEVTTPSASNDTHNLLDATRVLHRKRKEIVQNIPVFPDPRNNVTQISVPCQTFTRGGLYEMQVVTNLKSTATVSNVNSSAHEPLPTMTTTTLMPVVDERLRQTLDVRWPSADMQVEPTRLRTYPEQPVVVTLRFPEVNCERAWHESNSLDLPQFWLELIYCGKQRNCNEVLPQNISKSSILYMEQVRGYPKHKAVHLGCELFGLAGNYAVQLRPMVPAPNVPITRRFLSVDWSDKFVFNVYARSIFPCDPHTGIGVLYEYPSCILEQGDRVRVFAKLRADVASLKPPTTLHYVAEQRVVKSHHSLYFSCELFTEKFVEYCFVYVSQAISGAVADVRMDCVPTLPVSDSDTGGWGPWSEWTPCSTNCLGGTRNRYRFCDSPPPRYGAKFCEGPSVETEKCGKAIADTWDCIYESSGATFTAANRTEVSQEIGPGCRCGCIVHLGSSKSKRILAGATQSCPGRSFWLIQVDGEENIALSLNFLRLPCPAQYIKVRDGPSLSSTLLIELNGGSNLNMPTQIESSGAQLLLEFYAGEASEVAVALNKNNNNQTGDGRVGGGIGDVVGGSVNAACTGGFLANVEQISRNDTTTLFAAATSRLSAKNRSILQKPKFSRTNFTLVHLSAVVFASIIILISALLGAQYVVRYRKYHLAVARRRDEGSRLHTPRASMSSLHGPPSRAISTTTLLSEVIYLVKMRPKHQLRHSILRESVDAENLARDTEFNDPEEEEEEEDAQTMTRMVKCDEERGSNASVVTLRNEVPQSPESVSGLSRSPSLDEALGSTTAAGETSGICSGTLTRKDSGKDTESIISSGMSSICASPPIVHSGRFNRYGPSGTLMPHPSQRLEETTLSDRDSIRSSLRDYVSRCASASLTNGCYSPAASVVSTANIRTTNAKESKDKQNRKKLLARPGSEFSLGNQEELELDYYDYNVINAGAAPGSYLGMDPAQLIWVPPLEVITDLHDEDDKTPEPTHEPEETEPLYEEIKMPRYGHYLSARSNTESSANTTSNTTPSSDELSPLSSHLQSKATSPTAEMNLKNNLMQQTISTTTGSKQPTPYFSRKQRRQSKQQSRSTSSLRSGVRDVIIPLQKLSGTKSARNIRTSPTAPEDIEAARATPRCSPVIPEALVNSITDSMAESMTGSYVEKETVVEKKTPPELSDGLLGLDDIQYADESESDHDLSSKKKSKYDQVSTEGDTLKPRVCNLAVAAKLKRVSADSAILEKRGLVREPSSYRIETNV